jgi:putative transposase
MQTPIKTTAHSVYNLNYHIVFVTKYRRKVLVGLIADRLQEIVRDVAEETGSEVIELEVMPDHVHLICEVDPQFGIAKFIRLCKGRTSRLLRQEFPTLKTRLPTLWTNSVFISTVGGAPLSVIKQYIEQQKRSESRTSQNG